VCNICSDAAGPVVNFFTSTAEVEYLGMRVNALTGIKTLVGFGPKISQAVNAKPDGLLVHENLLYSLRHFGMRQCAM
jgi:hypothetical protein